MPSAMAQLATREPMAPRPTTPSVLPLISLPTNCFLPFSTLLAMAASPASPWVHWAASATLRLPAISIPMTSSATALALAPGVLNTTMPCSLQRSSGMLLTPAPARAMASRLSLNVVFSRSALRTRMPSGASESTDTSKRLLGSFARPTGLMALRVLMVNILSDLLYTNQAFALRNFSIKSTSLSMPSLGMAL